MYQKDAWQLLFLFSSRKGKDVQSMNKKKSIWSGVSVLIAAVLAIVAFVRSDTQIWLLTAAFTIWAIWVTAAFVFPYIQEQENEKRRAARRAAYDAQRQSLRALSVEEEDGFGPLLLRHVNHRISAYLKAVYPDATWEWRSPEPEKLILHGGTGRITISGIPDYDQAEVTFDQKANFSCSLLKVTPVVQSEAENGTSEKLPAPPREIDPQAWFEQQGRKVLDDLIYDLNSRGYSSLVIKDNGDICIRQGDVEKAQTSFKSLPEKHYWPRLLKVFEREGIAASMTDDAIALNW